MLFLFPERNLLSEFFYYIFKYNPQKINKMKKKRNPILCIETGVELSPCIISQEKYFLGLKDKRSKSKKTASSEYRERVRRTLRHIYELSSAA
jgi:hypothetical protein